MNYTLEILRDGTVVDTRDLAGKDHYTMGRTPDNGEMALPRRDCRGTHGPHQTDGIDTVGKAPSTCSKPWNGMRDACMSAQTLASQLC